MTGGLSFEKEVEKKKPFHVFHCCVNVVTRRCHSEMPPSRGGPPESTLLIGGQLVLLKRD